MMTTSTDILVKEVSSSIHYHHRHVSEQPIDRHLIEITDQNKGIFINAGIDSTCGKKRAAIIHIFNNGIITPVYIGNSSSSSIPIVDQLDLLTLNHPEEVRNTEELSIKGDCGTDIHIHEACSQCGK